MYSQLTTGENMTRHEEKKQCFPTTGYIRPNHLAELLGVSPATIWRYAKRPEFPKPIKLSARATAFSAVEIHNWLDSKKA